jgi:hypothetical protein
MQEPMRTIVNQLIGIADEDLSRLALVVASPPAAPRLTAYMIIPGLEHGGPGTVHFKVCAEKPG